MEDTLDCPICTLKDLVELEPGRLECVTCGHQWSVDADGADQVGEIRDAFGAVLQSGDSVALIKDLKLKGTSDTIKVGTKIKRITLVSGDHPVDCKVAGRAILLKAEFVKKA